MPVQIDAVYESGVLKPLEPPNLAENEHVSISVTRKSEMPDESEFARGYIENLRKELASGPPVLSHEEVRRLMSTIPGNLSDDAIAERGDY